MWFEGLRDRLTRRYVVATAPAAVRGHTPWVGARYQSRRSKRIWVVTTELGDLWRLQLEGSTAALTRTGRDLCDRRKWRYLVRL